MTDKPFIVNMPAVKDEIMAQVEAMKRNLPAHLEYAVVLAKIRKASYDAFIAEGFSEEQAFEMCMED